MPIHNTKDNSFKLIFGNHELFVQFLRDFIPLDILKTLKPEDIEDISERFLPLFQESRDSDTVKRINLGGDPPLFLIAILEHESKVNHRAGFKMLQYICLVLDHYEKEVNAAAPGISSTKDFRYPPVLPIVFYDGNGAWTAEKNFAPRTRMKEVFEKYIPSFSYELVDLNRYSLDDITRFGDALSVIMAIDKGPDRGGSLWLEKDFRDYVMTLNIPVNLRKLIGDVVRVLLGRLGLAEEKIAAAADMIEKKEAGHMFERFVEGILTERRLACEEVRAETWAKAEAETWAKAEAETRVKTQVEEEKKAYNDKLESARKLKAKGYPAGDIAESLSLPEEIVARM